MRTLLHHCLSVMLLACIGTASAQVQVVGSLVFEHNLKPGQQTVEGQLNLSNPTNTAIQAEVLLSDISSDPKVGTVYSKPGTLPRSNTSWIELPSSTVTVPAQGKLTVPYRIKVPQNTAPGTHWGVFLVRSAAAKKNTSGTGASTVTLREVTEYAVQVVVNLPGGQAKLKFLSPALSKTASGIALNVELNNAGERLSVPTTRVEIYDAQGQLVQKIEGRQRRVYPGLSVGEAYQINGLKPGKYQVLVLADDPNSEVVGARYNITVE